MTSTTESPRVTNWRTVSEVAKLAHVTVRTLHHYDEVGILTPSERTKAGYRRYSEMDLQRLQQILLYRELGFSLEAIRQVLDDPSMDRRSALRAQRELLVERGRRTEAVIRAIDRTLESIERGTEMKTHEMFEGFEDLPEAPDEVRQHHAAHAKEARESWGETDAYAESLRRAKGHSRKDWEAIQAEAASTLDRLVALMQAGSDPEGTQAMDVGEAMRLHISRWFYPCSHEMHAHLADMYEADPRFRAYYDDQAEGLASYVARAIRANALRAWEADP